jgi:hypothetical protein
VLGTIGGDAHENADAHLAVPALEESERGELGLREVDSAAFDTATERIICKVIETVCESVPASIIAMVALLLVGKWAWAPIVSIVISWITTAFKATSVSFSFDTNRRLRKLDPWFVPILTPHRHHTTTLVVCQCEHVQGVCV